MSMRTEGSLGGNFNPLLGLMEKIGKQSEIEGIKSTYKEIKNSIHAKKIGDVLENLNNCLKDKKFTPKQLESMREGINKLHDNMETIYRSEHSIIGLLFRKIFKNNSIENRIEHYKKISNEIIDILNIVNDNEKETDNQTTKLIVTDYGYVKESDKFVWKGLKTEGTKQNLKQSTNENLDQEIGSLNELIDNNSKLEFVQENKNNISSESNSIKKK